MDLLLGRRSIRKYGSGAISGEIERRLLEAAMAAPSARNARPWHFVVIRDREILDRIPDFHPYAKMCLQAPMAILVCADTALQAEEGYWVQDCAAATENLLLAAHEAGLGAVWLGIHPNGDRIEGVTRLVNLPEGIRPLSLVALGHPAETRDAVDRFDASRIHADRW